MQRRAIASRGCRLLRYAIGAGDAVCFPVSIESGFPGANSELKRQGARLGGTSEGFVRPVRGQRAPDGVQIHRAQQGSAWCLGDADSNARMQRGLDGFEVQGSTTCTRAGTAGQSEFNTRSRKRRSGSGNKRELEQWCDRTRAEELNRIT